MRIFISHNFYGSSAPSGENAVFDAEKALLESRGHKVATFTRHSDEIRAQGALGALKGAFSTPWNPFSARAILGAVDSFKPDVVHVHNTFPLLSPAIFHAIGQGAATVLTLHNYRLVCPAAIPMRDGNVCTSCIDKQSVLPALQYGCYRNSRVATVPLAMNVALHRAIGTWKHKVDAFIALSEFQKSLMARGGLPLAKIHVKPNFYPGNPAVVPWAERQPYVVFVGRLSEEKGVHTLLQAWRAWGADAPELRLVGDGPLRAALELQAAGLPVRFLGQVPFAEAQAQVANASLLVLSSECFEGFPMVVREAFAFGTPVAVSDIGPLPSIVQHGSNGVVFPPANPAGLLAVLQAAWRDQPALERMGRAARESFETLYNEDANYQMLMQIYQQAIEQNRSGQ